MRDGKAYGIWLWLAAVAVTLAVCTTSYGIQQAIPVQLRHIWFLGAMGLPPLMFVLLLTTGYSAWRERQKRRGVLFAALAVVVAWYGLAFFFQQLFITIDSMKCIGAEADLTNYAKELQQYRTDVSTGTYPATLLQLYSDNAPGWSGPYLATITPDPWDNQYTYTTDGAAYTLQTVHGRGKLYRDYTPGTIRLVSGSDTPERIP